MPKKEKARWGKHWQYAYISSYDAGLTVRLDKYIIIIS